MIDFQTWKKAWAFLNANEKRHAWVTLGGIIIAALSAVLMVSSIMPFLFVLSDPAKIKTIPVLLWAYETFGFTSDYLFLKALGIASIVIILLANVIQIGKVLLVAQFTKVCSHAISHRLLLAYLRQPYIFFQSRHSGEMGARILDEAQNVVEQYLRPAAEGTASLLTILALFGMLVWIDTRVALMSFAVLTGAYGLIYLISKDALNRYGKTRANANCQRYKIVNEALSGIKDIKLLGLESAYSERYKAPSKKVAATQATIQIISQVPQYLLQVVAFGGVILLCLILVDNESFTTGKIMADLLPMLGVFAFAGQRLMPELSKLYQSLAKLQAGRVAVNMISEGIALQAGLERQQASTQAKLRLTKSILLEDITFQYPAANIAGLKSLCLEIMAGEKIGVVGATGAGKTTLADLILGLLSPSQGQVVVDLTPITQTNLRAWQQSVSYVPQDIFLIDASINANIAFGLTPEEIDYERVIEAAKIAQLHSFILENLPDGYSTQVGERGVRLSGGQRQRLGIARAMYYDADLIIFDEATSALDNLTETEVMTAVNKMPGDKTVIIIAHRLSTVKACDKIVMLDEGGLVGFDTWENLSAYNSMFQKFAEITSSSMHEKG